MCRGMIFLSVSKSENHQLSLWVTNWADISDYPAIWQVFLWEGHTEGANSFRVHTCKYTTNRLAIPQPPEVDILLSVFF